MTVHSGRLNALAWGLALLAFAWGGPAAAVPASAFGPEVKVGEGKGGYVGALDVMPEHGKAGTPFKVLGEKFPPNQEVQLIWRTVNGRWTVTETEYKGREFIPADYLMAKVKSDAQGRFTANFTTPDDFGFEHDIVAQQGASFTIPATGNVGDHILQVTHGALTFPYQNPEQNPAQGRPRFSFMFKVTPGTAVLPAAPELQAQKNVRRLPAPGELLSAPRFSGVGETVKVNGGGFEPGKIYKLNWTRVIGNRMTGQGGEDISVPVAEAKADASGRVEFALKTPDDLGGTHGLWVEKGKAKTIGTHFIKATALPLDVTKGPVGTKFTIHLKGVGWTETANIMHEVYDNSYNGYVCAFNSQGDVEINMQASG